MLQNLSEYIGVTVTEQSNGQVNILVGTGQPLVVGTRYEALSLGPGRYDPVAFEVEIEQAAGNSVPITESISGGIMQGLLRFRDETLNGARQELGLLAAGVTETLNAQHKLGLDLTGARQAATFLRRSRRLQLRTTKIPARAWRPLPLPISAKCSQPITSCITTALSGS